MNEMRELYDRLADEDKDKFMSLAHQAAKWAVWAINNPMGSSASPKAAEEMASLIHEKLGVNVRG